MKCDAIQVSAAVFWLWPQVGGCEVARPLSMGDWEYFSIRGSAACADGSVVHAVFHAYAYCQSDEVYWDISSVLESLMSYRKNVQVWKELWKAQPHWSELCQHLETTWEAERSPSKKQCKRGFSEARDTTRTCQTVSTRLLIIILLGWVSMSKLQKVRARAKLMAVILLSHCSDVSSFDAQGLSAAVAEHSANCAENRHGLGQCPHMPPTFLDCAMAEESPPARMVSAGAAAFEHMFACDGARAFAATLVRNLVRAVHTGLAALQPVQPHKLPVKRSACGRAKPAEDTYKKYALRTLVSSQKAKNGKGLMKLDDYAPSVHNRWVSKDCASYAVTAARQMSGAVGVLACFEDAARLGNPAREVVVYVTWSASLRKGAAMPPQVLCRCVTRSSRQGLVGHSHSWAFFAYDPYSCRLLA